jgi:N-hydroxyarylamine O-acetyltransferase
MIAEYFARVGYSGSGSADLNTLRAVHALHVATIPFENFSPFLGEAVLLELEALKAKLIKQRRGGYCYEQNGLFKAVLEEVGFGVQGLAARVHWMSSPQENPRAHMALLVNTEEGPYLADVGFGGYLLDAPLKLIADVVQRSPTSIFRFEKNGASYILQVDLNGVWQNVYQFTTEPAFPIDYEMSNWYNSAHPKSKFRRNLMISRLTPSIRSRLLNKKLTKRYADGRVEELVLTSPGMLADIVLNEMCIDMPVDPANLFGKLS